MTKTFPWKGSHRSIPATISASLGQIKSNLVMVAATKKILVKTIAAGQYAHLGLQHDGSAFEIADTTMPAASVGKIAARNRMGWEVRRTDLPKIKKTFSWESPNFGDGATYGYHTHYREREVYPVQYFEPRLFSIDVELLNSPGVDTALVKFQIDQVLDRTADTFEDDLLFALNLLQESTGVVGVYASDASREDFIGTVLLDWEVFPPGSVDELIASLTRHAGSLSPEKAGIVADRVKLFNQLPVEHLIRGAGSFGTYVGALYADDLVVFENVNYGNALYVLYADWQDVSKRSRLDLIKGTSENFDRIVHTDGWQLRFTELIEAELKKRGRWTRR